ncbi:MAG: hypothetical protein COA33_015075 [Fluviicola sp.]|nr:hypothetical protein [Fluviicola sp.]
MSFWTPHIDSSDFREQGRFLLAWRLSLITSLIVALLTINFRFSSLHLMTYFISFLLTVLCVAALHYTKKSKFIFIFSSITGTIIVSFNLITLNELYQVGNILWKVYIITFTFFGLGQKWGISILLLNLASLIYYALFQVNTNLDSIIPLDEFGRISLSVELTVVTLLIAYVIYQFSIINNLSYNKLLSANDELLKQNQTIESQNEEKTTLVKEIHHRVKNNLQIIISLLRLQKSEIKSKEAENHLSQAINRIMAMSLIHTKLYQEDELAKVNLESYLQELSDDIKSLTETGFKTTISVSSDIDQVGLKTIVPLGLLINELVSNSIQHAFKNNSVNRINTTITHLQNNFFKLKYSDNGRWKEPTEGGSTFGLELIEILTEQLDGKIEQKPSSENTTYEFTLKNIEMT